jgi:hypothetical protein
MSPHEEFLELCAASTAGELTKEQSRKLDEHLSGCAACREALEQFQETVQVAVPTIAAGLSSTEPEVDGSWSREKAEAALFERLVKEDGKLPSRQIPKDVIDALGASRRDRFPFRFGSGQIWMTYAAAVLLFLALAISAYRVGMRRGAEVATTVPAKQAGISASLEAQLSDLSHDRETLRSELVARDKAIDDLKQQVERLRAAEKDRVEQSAHFQKEQKSHGAEEAANSNAELADLQRKLDASEKARSEDSSRAATLEAKVADLTQELHSRDETVAAQTHELQSREGTVDQQQAQIAEQKELLDHDRDIRELMGARELYVAEVIDVGKDAATKKSYGRIFFTKGKSLIFYAYDLDRQPGVKNASAFQVWGQRGTDREQALNLGVLYEDSVSKKRWILKFDDPKKLAQIDAVFVTVEPNGGSPKPSSKPFLYAYLKVSPNHP